MADVRYARGSDGVAIAFTVEGSGPALVRLPMGMWFSDLGAERNIDEIRAWLEHLGQGRTLVLFDARGSGLSQREVDDVEFQTQVGDIAAVVEAAGVETFALFAHLHAVPVAVEYALRDPERVTHLVLLAPYLEGGWYFARPEFSSLMSIVDNWELFSETLAHARIGWPAGDAAHRFAALIRDVIDAPTLTRIFASARATDLRGRLELLSVPTLILQPRDLSYPDVATARDIASRIPDARLVVLQSSSLLPYVDDLDGTIAAIDAFVPGGRAPASTKATGFRTIVFTDVEGSTDMTERLGDAAARAVLRDHEASIRRVLVEHGGDEVKTLGDGFMAVFGSATAAIAAAWDMQRAFSEEGSLRIRIGINAGEPVAEEDDYYGSAVNIAARVGGVAAGGQTLVTNVVRELVRGKGFVFDDGREVELKGIADPVQVYQLLKAT